MHLVQILLPLVDNEGQALPAELFRTVRGELSARFGGLTAFTRAPAEGDWRVGDETCRDDIVVFEVMAEAIAREWWAEYRRKLEHAFRQHSIVVRAQPIELL